MNSRSVDPCGTFGGESGRYYVIDSPGETMMVLFIRHFLIEINWIFIPINLELENFVIYTTESESVVDQLGHDNSAVGALRLKL